MTLARMVWGTYAVKIEVQMGNYLIVEGSKMHARMVVGTYNHQNFDKVAQFGPKIKYPRVPG